MDEFYPNSLTHTLKQYIVCKRKLEGFKEARVKRCLHFEAFSQVSHFIFNNAKIIYKHLYYEKQIL